MATHRRTSMRAELDASEAHFTVARFARRAVIFEQGCDADSVMYVESGRVELMAVAPSGKVGVCGLAGPGAFLGEEALAGSVARPHTATAMEPTEVLIFGKAAVQRLLSVDRRFAERFVAHTVSRTTRLAAGLTDQLLYSSEERLARVLLELADYDSAALMPCTLPDVTQEFIARMVGTTRSRVNKFLGKFKKLGFVEMSGGVIRVHPALLQGVSDGDMRSLGSVR